MISLYTDGSSGAGGGKAGGWAWVLLYDDRVVGADYGGDRATTNNVMELMAAIEGMKAVIRLRARNELPRHEPVELVSDSQYALLISNGSYTPGKNIELARLAKELAAELNIRVRWVRGHSGDTWNERCDSLARRGKHENTPHAVLMKQLAKKRKIQKQSA